MPTYRFQLPNIKSVAKVLGIYGAGVVTAGFFLSGPGEYAGNMRANELRPAYEQQQSEPHRQAAAPVAPVQRQAASDRVTGKPPPATTAAAEEAPESRPTVRQVRVIPIVPPSTASTDGFGGERREATRVVASDAQAGEAAAPAGCNVSACSAQYRSFDVRTCTYRSYSGDTRRCTR